MVKVKLDNIKRRTGYSNEKYQNVISKIIANNSENISNRMLKISSDKWKTALTKLQRTMKEERKYIIPDISEIKPERAYFIRKAAEKGKLISDTLRDRLTKNLRDSITTFTERTHEANFIRRRGEKSNKINPKLIKDFQDNITNTFEGYVKRDKTFGMPTNIHTIASFEMRSTIHDIQNRFMSSLENKNPEIQLMKKWIHNKILVKHSRPGHVEVSRLKPIPFNQFFSVPLYKEIGGKKLLVEKTLMAHPHDETAPLSQLLNCECDIEYSARPKRIVK